MIQNITKNKPESHQKIWKAVVMSSEDTKILELN